MNKKKTGKKAGHPQTFKCPEKYAYLQEIISQHDDFILYEIENGNFARGEFETVPMEAMDEYKRGLFSLLPVLVEKAQEAAARNPDAAQYGRKELPAEKTDCTEKIFAADILTEEYKLYSTYPSLSHILDMPLAGAMWLVRTIRKNGRILDLMELLAPYHDEKAYEACYARYVPKYFFDNENNVMLYVDVLIAFLRRNCTEKQAESADNWMSVDFAKLMLKGARASDENPNRKLYDMILELAGTENCENARNTMTEALYEHVGIYCRAFAEYCVRTKPPMLRAAARMSASMDSWDAQKGFVNIHFMNGADDVWNFTALPYAPLAVAAHWFEKVPALAVKVTGRMSRYDPYELMFGFLQMVDSADVHLSMLGSMTAVLSNAAAGIPWLMERYLVLSAPYGKESEYKDYNEIIPHDTDTFAAYKHLDTEKKYELPYQDKQSFISGFANGNSTANYSLRHILYHLTGCCIDMPAPDNELLKERKVMMAAGMPAEEADRITDIAAVLREFDIATCQDELYRTFLNGDRDYRQAYRTSEDDLEEQITILQNQIQELMQANSRLETAYKEQSKQMRSLRMENYQLAHTGVAETEVPDVTKEIDPEDIEEPDDPGVENVQHDVCWPYTASSRIVVVGGHDSWLRSMKQRFTNVRFEVSESGKIDANLLRNADIVLLQYNAMGHSLFHNVQSICTQNNTPIRYIRHAGWKSASFEIVNVDREFAETSES